MRADKFSVRVNRDVKAEVWRRLWIKAYRPHLYTKWGMGCWRMDEIGGKGSVEQDYAHSYTNS